MPTQWTPDEIARVRKADPKLDEAGAIAVLDRVAGRQTDTGTPPAPTGVRGVVKDKLAAAREVVSRVPGLGPLLALMVPQNTGELAAEGTALALPLLGAVAATNPVTAPLSPFLIGGGAMARAGRLAKVGGAVGRAALTGAAGAAGEAVTGGEDALGTGLRTGAGALAAEPVAGVLLRVFGGTLARPGVMASDMRKLGEIVTNEVVDPLSGAPVFGAVRSVSDLAEVAHGERGIGALQRVFALGEHAVTQRVGGNPRVDVPSLARHLGRVDPQTGQPLALPLNEALSEVKRLGAVAFRGERSAQSFPLRQAWRDAQAEIEAALTQVDPEAAVIYRGVRSTYARGTEVVGLLNERGVFTGTPNGVRLNMDALQRAALDNLRSLEQRGLRGSLVEQGVYRGGPIGSQDATTAVPILARMFSSGPGPSAGVWAAPTSLGFTRYTGAPEVPAWMQALMAGARGTGATLGERALRDQP